MAPEDRSDTRSIEGRPRRLAIMGVSLVASAALLWQLGEAMSDGVVLAAVLRGAYPGTGIVKPPPSVPLSVTIRDSAGSERQIDLRGKAIVLVYDAACGTCNSNAPRWLDLIAEARARQPEVPVYAMSLRRDSLDANRAYWRGLERLVQPIELVDSSTAVALAGGSLTPTTIVLRNGQRLASHVGYVGERRRRYLLSQLEN